MISNITYNPFIIQTTARAMPSIVTPRNFLGLENTDNLFEQFIFESWQESLNAYKIGVTDAIDLSI